MLQRCFQPMIFFSDVFQPIKLNLILSDEVFKVQQRIYAMIFHPDESACQKFQIFRTGSIPGCFAPARASLLLDFDEVSHVVSKKRLFRLGFLRVELFHPFYDRFDPLSDLCDQALQIEHFPVMRDDLPVVISDLRSDALCFHMGNSGPEMHRRHNFFS